MTHYSFKASTRNFGKAKALWSSLVFALCLLLGLPSLHAQLVTGSFAGTVQDPTGAVVSGASISLQNQATGFVRNTVSNASGYFTFAGVDPGTYTATVQAKGFKSWKQSGLTLNSGDERSITGIKLSLGDASQTVVVESGEQQLVPTDNGERSALITSKDIDRLSVQGREISELLKILPGVTTVANGTSNGVGFSFTEMGADGSDIGVGLSPNGAPYRGGTAYLLDGANIIDPGCNCWSIASVNPDMTAEVKIQTSNFGADNADGPVSVNVTSKSGGDQYHGEAYMYTRNGVLNSNLWQNNHNHSAKTEDEYYYPGGNIGGPVRIPGTDFNKDNKLLFWVGYEYQWQNPGSSTILNSDIPSADMENGNFTSNGLTDSNPYSSTSAICPSGFSLSAANWCKDPTGGYDANGTLITDPSHLAVDPGAKAIMSLFPAANVNPANNSGHNYYLNTGAQQNVYIIRGRVDYNLNDNNKFFASYQQGHEKAVIPSHMWWNQGDGVPYPGGGLINPTTSRVLTGDLLTVLSPTLTNELVGAWGYVNTPVMPANITPSLLTSTGYPYKSYFGGSLVTPGIYADGDQSFPDMSMPDLWTGEGGAYGTEKSTASFSDHVTKVYKTHTFKFGVFTEMVGADQGAFESYNGVFSFDSAPKADPLVGPGTTLGGSVLSNIGTDNATANLVMGIASNFTQNSSTPLTNMAYRTTSAYAMDDWKVAPRLMLNIGWRFDHIGRWYDRTGNGMAAWFPGLYNADVSAGSMPFPGVRWHGIDPGVPNSGSTPRALYISPRMGLAYDLFGTGKTVLRGGWGEYRWNDQYNDYAGPVTVAANMQSYSTPSGNIRFSDIGALGSLARTSNVSLPTGSVNVVDPQDHENAGTEAYNLTISQQLPWSSLLEVAYVGNQTKNLLMGGQSNSSGLAPAFINQNKVALGGVFGVDPVTGAAAPSDPDNTGSYNLTDYYPYYQGYGQNQINMETHVGYSNYNGFQVEWLKQTGRLSFNLNYTWSKSLGIAGTTIDPFTVHGNYNILNIDRPQVVNTSYAYSLGRLYTGDNPILSGAANGWTVSGTTTLQSGGNLQATDSPNLGLSIADGYETTPGNIATFHQTESVTTLSYYGTNAGGDIQPVLTCNPKSGFSRDHQELNPLCFAPPTLGVHGPRQYSYLGGPAYFNSDLTIFKSFHITGKQTVQFRAAMFNFLNHPLRAYTTTQTIAPTFDTTDKVNFASSLLPIVPTLEHEGLYLGTPDQKVGYRLGELSVKYNF